MAIGIDPLVDFACKKLLGSPEHPTITLHFLNAVLGGSPKITEVEILNPIIEKDFEEDKYAILDIRARDEIGHRFNIEIQRSRPAALRERLTYYAATQLIEQLGDGDSYTKLRPSIGICILDLMLYPHVSDVHLDFRLRNENHRLTLTDHLQIHLLELPKYALPSDNQVIVDPIEQWCFFFLRADELTTDQIVQRLPSPVFAEATGVLEMIARDPKQRSLYESRLKAERDVRAKEEYAHEKGREEGREEGEAIGRVKLLRQLLGDDLPLECELRSMSLEDLALMEADLQHRLRERS